MKDIVTNALSIVVSICLTAFIVNLTIYGFNVLSHKREARKLNIELLKLQIEELKIDKY